MHTKHLWYYIVLFAQNCRSAAANDERKARAGDDNVQVLYYAIRSNFPLSAMTCMPLATRVSANMCFFVLVTDNFIVFPLREAWICFYWFGYFMIFLDFPDYQTCVYGYSCRRMITSPRIVVTHYQNVSCDMFAVGVMIADILLLHILYYVHFVTWYAAAARVFVELFLYVSKNTINVFWRWCYSLRNPHKYPKL